MKKIDPIILGIIFISLVILGGIILASRYSSGNPAASYKINDVERPKIEISEKDFDLGKMKVSETKTKEIIIKSMGTKPLNVSDFTTSCDCTSVVVNIDGKDSPKFSMHTMTSWQKELAPEQTATLKIIYEPSVMPVEGEVSRVVHFKTNDPEMLDVQINFKAFVEG